MAKIVGSTDVPFCPNFATPQKQHRVQHGGVRAGIRPAALSPHFLLHAAFENGGFRQKTCPLPRRCQLDFPQHVNIDRFPLISAAVARGRLPHR